MAAVDFGLTWALTAALPPMALGLAVVLWPKVRAARHRRAAAEIDPRLRGLFRRIEHASVPERLMTALGGAPADG